MSVFSAFEQPATSREALISAAIRQENAKARQVLFRQKASEAGYCSMADRRVDVRADELRPTLIDAFAIN